LWFKKEEKMPANTAVVKEETNFVEGTWRARKAEKAKMAEKKVSAPTKVEEKADDKNWLEKTLEKVANTTSTTTANSTTSTTTDTSKKKK